LSPIRIERAYSLEIPRPDLDRPPGAVDFGAPDDGHLVKIAMAAGA